MREKRPNVVLTIADDQRGTALGLLGIEAVRTPALDALAARGTAFTQAQHMGSPHGAVCAPSRAMLHTGMPYFGLPPEIVQPDRVPGAYGEALPALLGENFREAGYRTFVTGKWHNGRAALARSFDHGAAIFLGGMADHWFTPVHDFDPTGAYPDAQARRAQGFSTEIFARAALDFIRSQRGSGQPFFCYCAFTAPHDPLTPPDRWRQEYDPRDVVLPPNIQPRFFDEGPAPPGVRPAFDNGSLDERDELLLGVPRDASELRRRIAEYHAMISHMDEWIGQIHAAIREIGAGEDTLVIHTADHGLALGQHGLLGKQNLYRHSVNVPLLLAGPGIPAGRRCDALVYQHDLHPTLAERIGAAPGSPAFRSLDAALAGGPQRSSLGAAFRSSQRSIRTRRHKLIEYNVRGRRFSELFDLVNDPWETASLMGTPGSDTLHSGLRDELCRWSEAVGDDFQA